MTPSVRAAVVLPVLAVAALTACSSSATPPVSVEPGPGSATVTTLVVPGLGPVLASDGRALYVFSPDHHATVSCTGVCAGTWPPLRSRHPLAGPSIAASDLGSVTSPDGYPVATFHGWPLYAYAGDDGPTRARGQALFLNGGPWYTIQADGTIVTTGSNPR